jgi:hypothetical protein
MPLDHLDWQHGPSQQSDHIQRLIPGGCGGMIDVSDMMEDCANGRGRMRMHGFLAAEYLLATSDAAILNVRESQ